jgi:hypothetical protein
MRIIAALCLLFGLSCAHRGPAPPTGLLTPTTEWMLAVDEGPATSWAGRPLVDSGAGMTAPPTTCAIAREPHPGGLGGVSVNAYGLIDHETAARLGVNVGPWHQDGVVVWMVGDGSIRADENEAEACCDQTSGCFGVVREAVDIELLAPVGHATGEGPRIRDGLLWEPLTSASAVAWRRNVPDTQTSHIAPPPPQQHVLQADLNKPATTYVSTSQAPATPVVSRWPAIEAPPTVRPATPFTVLVSLTAEPNQADTTAVAGADETGAFELELPAGHLELTVILTGAHLEFPSGNNTGKLTVLADGDSTPAVFEVVAPDRGVEGYDEPVHATFLSQGSFVGRASRTLRVGAPGAGPPTQTETSSAPIQVDLLRPPPDLTVIVQHPDSERPGFEVVNVELPRLLSRNDVRVVARDERDAWVAARVGALAAYRARSLPLVRPVPSKAGLADALGLGRQLWTDFVPEVVRQAIWTLHDRPGTGRTLQIHTDDPSFPWELVRPQRLLPDGTLEELDLLGIEFQVARAHVSWNEAPRRHPPLDVPFTGLAVVAPEYTGSRTLPHQAAEVAALQAIPGFRRIAGTFPSVSSELASPGSPILHFSGHGTVVDDGGAHTYAVELEDRALGDKQWRGLAGPNHPFVFFNACDVGDAHAVAHVVDGWAPALLGAGAPGYIGGLWPLGDAAATDAARVFYAAILERLAEHGVAYLTEVLATVRAQFHVTGDPTYLGYVFYGDPRFAFVAATAPE